ncbi:MAG: hypothetical protein ACRDPB_06310 [Nocardioidaceae bacterium]
MPLGQGILDAVAAIPIRIELSGHGPTWQVSAGSFEDAWGYARERFGEPTVLARHDRGRWWPRVSITVCTDPGLAATAPSLETLSGPPAARHRSSAEASEGSPNTSGPPPSTLEEIFTHAEQARRERLGIPEQRGPEPGS